MTNQRSHTSVLTPPQNGVLVYFYGKIEPRHFPFRCGNVHLTVEDILVDAAKHLITHLPCGSDNKSGLTSLMLPLFGLVNIEHTLWINPRERFSYSDVCHKFFFRIRFRMVEAKLDALFKMDKHTSEYLYLQCKDDFVNDRLWTLYKKKLDLENILGFVVMGLLIPSKKVENGDISQQCAERREQNTVDSRQAHHSLSFVGLKKYLPKSVRKDFMLPWRYLRLYLSVSGELSKFLRGHGDISSDLLQKSYVKGVLESVPNYGVECYRAVEVLSGEASERMKDREVDVIVDPYVSRPAGIFFAHEFVCCFEDITNIFLSSSTAGQTYGGTVQLHYKSVPKVLLFKTKEMAESFVSAVDGYYRLMVDYYSSPCITVEPPSLQWLRDLKSFGPWIHEEAALKLKTELLENQQKQISQKNMCFLLYQSFEDRNRFIVVRQQNKDLEPQQMEVVFNNDETITLFTPEEDTRTLRNLKHLLRCLREDARQIRPKFESYLMDLLRDDDTPYYYSKDNRDDISTKQRKQPICFSDRDICSGDSKFVGEGRYTHVFKGLLNNQDEDEDIVIKQLKSGCSEYMNAFQESFYRLMTLKHAIFIRFFGVLLMPPVRFMVEFAPCGSLESLLKQLAKDKQELSLLQIMSAMEQVSQGLHFMEEQAKVHGNLRCRNILVSKAIETDILIKIGDPGIVSYFNQKPLSDSYNQERLPWIAVELFSDLSKVTIQSEIYAFATTWWEMLSQGEHPKKAITVSTPSFRFSSNLEEVFKKGNCEVLPLPQGLQPIVVTNAAGPCSDNLQPHSSKTVTVTHPLQAESDTDTSCPWNKEMQDHETIPLTLLSSQNHQQEGVHNAIQLHQQDLEIDAGSGEVTLPHTQDLKQQQQQEGDDVAMPPAQIGLSEVDQSTGQPQANQTQEDEDSRSHQNSDNHGNSMDKVKEQIWTFIQKCWCLEPENRPDAREILRTVLHFCDIIKEKMDREGDAEEWKKIDEKARKAVLARVMEKCDSNRARGGNYGDLAGDRLKPAKHLAVYIKEEQLVYDKSPKGALGQGFYGTVRRATLLPPSCTVSEASRDNVERLLANGKTVAVKELKNTDGVKKDEFFKEMDLVQMLSHKNIVKMEGICLSPKQLLIMEYIEKGSLKGYLEKLDPNKSLSLDRMLCFCRDVAEGMIYLHSHNIVHRDLAARNVLLTKDMTAKISDFGLSRMLQNESDYYKCSPDKCLPVNWCAPEALMFRRFTKKGDIWSFGVLLWEIFSRGRKPHLLSGSLDKNNIMVQLYEELRRDKRLLKPDECPALCYAWMKMCWQFDADKRPDFEHNLTNINRALEALGKQLKDNNLL